MKILVCGGDGFCGWPATLRLCAAGHDVTILDNFSRRVLPPANAWADASVA